jgi:hypothetical protein
VEQVAVNATQRAILVGLLRNALELGCNLGPLTAYELAFVRSAVELMGAHRDDAYRSLSPLTPQGSYGLVKMLGNVLSARAKLGWSTFGHTGQDVKVRRPADCMQIACRLQADCLPHQRPGRQGGPPRCVRAECLLSAC